MEKVKKKKSSSRYLWYTTSRPLQIGDTLKEWEWRWPHVSAHWSIRIYPCILIIHVYSCISVQISNACIYIYPQHLVITCHHKYVHRFFQSKQCAAPSLLLVHPEVPSKQFVPSVLYFFFGSVDSWPSKLEIKSSRQFRPVAQPGENDRVHLADSDESENSLTKIQSDTEKYVTKCER